MKLSNSTDTAIRKKPHHKSHRRKVIIGSVIGLLLITGGIVLYRMTSVLDKVSQGGLLGSIAKSLPGVENTLKGEEEGRINVLLMGMRGENVPGGGLLTDTIMLMSAKPEQNLFSLVSIPRDLYVTVPESGSQEKINAVYHYGEQKGEGQGLEYMKQVVSEVSGLPVHYAASINFRGFEQLVDSVNGVDLVLEESFIEPLQFHEERVCDENVFTVPSGNYEEKIDHRGKIVARYPLCYNSTEECGGVFELPSGNVHLDGEKALCYVRSRVTSSDFDRARRQQEVLSQLKSKIMSAETLGDFSRMNELLGVLGDNVRSDMELWEMKRTWEMASAVQDPNITQKVLENSEEGLLYVPENTNNGAYLLLPRGDNYTKIHNLFATIFDPVTPEEPESTQDQPSTDPVSN